MEMEAIDKKAGCHLLKHKFKQRFAGITDADLGCTDGKDAMMERLEKKLGKTKEELRDIILNL